MCVTRHLHNRVDSQTWHLLAWEMRCHTPHTTPISTTSEAGSGEKELFNFQALSLPPKLRAQLRKGQAQGAEHCCIILMRTDCLYAALTVPPLKAPERLTD